MSTVIVEERVYDEQFGSWWWVFLVTGTLWLVLSLAMFQFDITSANSIGILAGIVFLIAGAFELLMVFAVHGGWWKLLNGALALLLIVGGIMAMIHPSNAFVAVASVTGFMFLFVGIVDVFVALADRTGLWWLRLVTGFVCIGLAFWASGDFQRKAVLLVVWVGLFALFRGIASYVVAFTLRHVHKELSAR
jgi:uncharacterized membrane protein HdeD (DUF308 family)